MEKEALSLIFGIRKFYHYLYGQSFTFITYHKALTTKHGIPALSAARMQRWALQLFAYSYSISDCLTKLHGNADSLSHLQVHEKLSQGRDA